MPKEYICRAYRLETCIATVLIAAKSQADALRQLKKMERNGDLDFDDHCEVEPINEFVIEEGNGDDELTLPVPENCLYAQRTLAQKLLDQLKRLVAIERAEAAEVGELETAEQTWLKPALDVIKEVEGGSSDRA